MSGIVLSSSVRQNLLSLQSTADLLATTQNRLSTGKKVNTALDNPTNYFTAASLDNRASDINNLLDGIGNGVQVLQAANTGISSLQKLVDSAKSVATQALQATVGYSTKSSVSVTINGATSDNLLGTGAPIDGSVNGANATNNQAVVYSASTGIGTVIAGTNQTAYSDATSVGSAATASSFTAYTSTAATLGGQLYSASATNATGSTLLSGLTDSSGVAQGIANNDTITINGKTITFQTGAAALAGSGNAYTLGIGNDLDTLAAALDTLQGNTGGGSVASTVTGGQIQLNSGVAADLAVSGSAGVLANLGLSGSTTATRGGHVATTPALAGSTLLSGTATSSNSVLSTAFQANDTITVNGQTLTFQASGASGANQINITDDVTTLLSKIDGLSGGSGSSISGGVITLHTGTTSDLSISSSRSAALTALGLGTGVTQARGGGVTNTSAITTGNTLLNGTQVPGGADALTSGLTTSDYLIVNNKTITFNSGTTTTGSIAGNNLSIGIGAGSTADIGDLLTAIGTATGGSATIDGTGKISLTTSLTGDISLAGSLSGTLTKLGLSATTTVTRTAAATPAITSSTLLSGASSASSDSLGTAFGVGDTITVNGQNLTFVASGAADNTHINIGDTVGNLLTKIDVLSGNTGVGATPSTVTGGHVTLHTGTTSDLTISSSNTAAFAALGFNAPVSQARGTGASQLNGQTLSFASTGGGVASNLTFGSGVGQVKSLNDLNNALAANNLQATLASNGTLTITTSNDAASSTIGAITGTAAASGGLFNGLTRVGSGRQIPMPPRPATTWSRSTTTS